MDYEQIIRGTDGGQHGIDLISKSSGGNGKRAGENTTRKNHSLQRRHCGSTYRKCEEKGPYPHAQQWKLDLHRFWLECLKGLVFVSRDDPDVCIQSNPRRLFLQLSTRRNPSTMVTVLYVFPDDFLLTYFDNSNHGRTYRIFTTEDVALYKPS